MNPDTSIQQRRRKRDRLPDSSILAPVPVPAPRIKVRNCKHKMCQYQFTVADTIQNPLITASDPIDIDPDNDWMSLLDTTDQ